MNKQTEALKMAQEVLNLYCEQLNSKFASDALKAIDEALAQPSQEPVAWRVLIDESPEDTDWHYMTGEPWGCFKQSAEPLYTHPAPSWQGLSDDEIQALALDNDVISVISQIEQALRNKNE